MKASAVSNRQQRQLPSNVAKSSQEDLLTNGLTSDEHRPHVGDRVLSVSGRRLGEVAGIDFGRFSITGWDGVWLDPSVVFHRQATTVTLICEQEGLKRFSLTRPN